jgi:hypothetical protein
MLDGIVFEISDCLYATSCFLLDIRIPIVRKQYFDITIAASSVMVSKYKENKNQTSQISQSLIIISCNEL